MGLVDLTYKPEALKYVSGVLLSFLQLIKVKKKILLVLISEAEGKKKNQNLESSHSAEGH